MVFSVSVVVCFAASLALAVPSVSGGAPSEFPHTDTRCNCKCPDVSIVADLTEDEDGKLIHVPVADLRSAGAPRQ